MDKEFLPYELAIQLKELGFYEPCYSYYFIYQNRLHQGFANVKFDYETKNEIFESVNNSIDAPKKNATSPTFRQAFRWFRDKNLRFNIGNDCTQVDGDYYYDVWRNGRFMYESNYIYKTYEEAELACLKKLIEIVKNK